MPVVIGLIVLLALLLFAWGFANADPRVMALAIRRIGGGVLMAFAAFFLVTGRWLIAIPVGAAGLALWRGQPIGGLGSPFGNPFSGGRPSPGKTSMVRSIFLEMTLDHDTGAMNGRVLAGHFEDQLLSDLGLPELLALREECMSDPQSIALLDTYLDKVHPDWNAGGAQSGANGAGGAGAAGPMTREEAYAILGLPANASEDAIRKAHRALMKQFHPDQGGSDYLASKINEAKDLLLDS